MVNVFRLVSVILLPLWLTGCAQQWQSNLLQDHPLVGQIYDTRTQKQVSRQQLVSELAQAHYVLIGEKHDNPDHHLLQRDLLTALVSADTQVVFEMLNNGQDENLLGLQSGMALDDIKQQLQWPQRGWAWQSYGPLFKTILDQQGTIISGNIGKQQLMKIYQQPETVAQQYDSINTINPEIRDTVAEQVYQQHCGMMARSRTNPMVNVQLARDAQMAKALQSSAKPKLLIAGGFHIRKDVSVPQHLLDDKTMLTLLLSEVSAEHLTVQDYNRASAEQVDYIWFTPKFSDEDYCARLKQNHGAKKQE